MDRADELIARFLKTSNEVERYLHVEGSLTALQHQTIATTIMGLQTIMQSWNRKHSHLEKQPLNSSVKRRKVVER